jgi:hypothetical protein
MNDWLKYSARHNPEIDEKFHQLNLDNIADVIYWYEFFQMVRHVPGDIVECGVGRGRSLIAITALNILLELDEGGRRWIFAYDSFCGFPEPTKQDYSPRNPKAGDWATSPSRKYRYTCEFLNLVLSSAGMATDVLEHAGFKLTARAGFFSESLPTHPRRPIALLHVDGDLYQSYMSCLDNLYPLVSPKGVIVFDDFLFQESTEEHFPGARRAVKEFLGAESAVLRPSRRGNTYYVKPTQVARAARITRL